MLARAFIYWHQAKIWVHLLNTLLKMLPNSIKVTSYCLEYFVLPIYVFLNPFSIFFLYIVFNIFIFCCRLSILEDNFTFQTTFFLKNMTSTLESGSTLIFLIITTGVCFKVQAIVFLLISSIAF